MESDALYFRLSEGEIEESEEVSKGLIIDYSEAGKIVGVEVLNLKERFTIEELPKLNIDMPAVAAR